MSFLDPTKETLNPVIFNKNHDFRDDVYEEIKGHLYRIVPEGKVHHLYLLGSMAGYQYNDQSDIDVMVVLKEGADRDLYHQRKKKAPKMFIGDPGHEVTFFFQKYNPDISFEDAEYAIYDLDNDEFIVDPRKAKYDPKVKFRQQMEYSGMLLDKINRLVAEYKEDKQDLRGLKKKTKAYKAKMREIRDDTERLVGWFRKLDLDRKTAYFGGFGIPRESQQNITYKMFEYDKNHKLIAELEERFDEEIPNLL